mgnify:CR=1 FL=1
MPKVNTLIIGGNRGIGSVIKQTLICRGDRVFTASRSNSADIDHYKINLPSQPNINLDVDKGDEILMGKFKNKKVKEVIVSSWDRK